MVHHQAFASGCGAFHFLESASTENGIDFPVAFGLGGFPVEQGVTAQVRGDVDSAVAVDCYDALEGGHSLLLSVRGTDGYFELLAWAYGPAFGHTLARALGGGDFRASEGPAGAVVHVDLQAEALAFGYGMAEHVHPLRRQIGYIIGFVAFDSVDRGDLDSSESLAGKLFEVVGETFGVNSASEPPPAHEGAVFGGDRIPVGHFCGAQASGACAEQKAEGQEGFIFQIHVRSV